MPSPQPVTTVPALDAGLRALTTPPPRAQLAPLSEVAGPQAGTVGYVAAETPLLVVALVAAHDGLDQATVQFLLEQALLACAEEVVAREQAELDQLEGDVALMEGQLLEELERDRDDAVRLTQTWAALSRVEKAAVLWSVAKEKVKNPVHPKTLK